MKIIILSLWLFAIVACNNNTPGKLNDNKSQESSIISLKEYTSVLGHWKICSENNNGEIIQYYSCPTIVFNSNGTGTKHNLERLAETFNWGLKNKILTIFYNEYAESKSFPDTNYTVIFKEGDLTLEIRQEKRSHSYYLSKL